MSNHGDAGGRALSRRPTVTLNDRPVEPPTRA
jgi:hypothetical protein